MTAIRTFTRMAFAAALAFTWTAASFGVVTAPASATDSRVHFRAELAQPVTERRQEVVRGVMWVCQGDSCIGTRGRSAPATECRRLVAEFGAVTAFSADGEAFTEDQVEACNA